MKNSLSVELLPPNFPLSDVIAAVEPFLGETSYVRSHTKMGELGTILHEDFGFEKRTQNGSFKYVYLHEAGFVLKVPSRFRSIDDMRLEWETYQKLRHVIPNHVPVTESYEHNIMVQERAEPNFNRFLRHCDAIDIVAKSAGIRDVRDLNIGWRKDGQFLFIDVGITDQKFKDRASH